MNISFGTCVDPVNKIQKTFNATLTADCILKEETSVTDPVVTLATDSSIVGCNYAYISDWGRYYYVTDIRSIRAGLWEVSLRVDVLKSFASAIYSSPCIISKNANNYNLYLNDANFKCYQDDVILKKQFPAGFDGQTDCFVMSIIGDKVAAT